MARFTTTVENNRLAYSSVGRDTCPPMILVHGLMSHRGIWQETMEVFKFSHYCVAPDLLGFADSPKPETADYSVAAQAQRILGLADALGFDRFDLIGHSMGGQIALYLASRLAPGRVNRLVSVAGVVTGRLSPWVERVTIPQTSIGAQMPFLYDWVYRLSRSRLLARLFFYPWFYRMDSIAFDSWEIDRQMACQRSLSHSANQSWSAIRSADLSNDLANIQAPTLVIFGQQDGVAPISESVVAKAMIPDSQLVVIDQCGHFPMYEQRDQFLDRLIAFFR